MDCREFQFAWVSDDHAERRDAERHASGCRHCAETVRADAALMDAVAHWKASAAGPSDRVGKRIASALVEEGRPSRRLVGSWAWVAAAAVLILGLAVLLQRPWLESEGGSYDQAIRQVEQAQHDYARAIAGLEQRANEVLARADDPALDSQDAALLLNYRDRLTHLDSAHRAAGCLRGEGPVAAGDPASLAGRDVMNRTVRNIAHASIAAVLLVLWVGAAAPPAEAAGQDDAIHKRIEREAEVRGRSVSIVSAVSNLTVGPGTDDRIHVTAKLEFWSNVDEWNERVEREFDVALRELSDRIDVTVTMPDFDPDGRRKVKTRYEVKLAVTLPRSTPLDIENRYGEVTVEGVGGPARIVNNSGRIRFVDGKGEVELNGRYGSIHARDIVGDLRAETTSGEIVVERVSGDATVATQYASVSVSEVGGRLDATASSGGVEASDVEGDAEITNSYANVTVERIGGRLVVTTKSGGIIAREIGREAELSSSYGSVEASGIGGNLKVISSSGPSKISDVEGSLELTGSYADAVVERIAGPARITVSSGGVTASVIEGDLTITCSYGTVRAADVRGALNVKASSTGVQAKRIAGAVDVETSYAGVTVVGAGGAVAVRNENGAINVKGLSGEALTARHDMETTYADIDFRWPENQGLSYRLKTSYGQIDCEFPGTLEDLGSRYTLEGSTGEGGASVRLVTKSGSVKLRGE